jgi:predicted TIM-barrel fold metal-dependent hydrolase
VNRNFTEQDLAVMKRDLTVGSLGAGGMRETHTVPNLLREMGELGVAFSVLLPIDFPVMSRNAEAYLEVASRAPGLVSLGSVHPYGKDIEGRLAAQKAAGALGVKVHPAVQMVAPDDDRAMALYRACAELSMPVLWHCGPVGIEPRLGRYLSNLKHYWPAIQANPGTTFILGHSGAMQMEMALDLANHYPNVYLEISSQSLSNVRRIITEGPEDRVMFGSDWPFYHQAIPLAKVLAATEDAPLLRRRVLWENAAQLFDLSLAQLSGAVAA